MKFRGIISRFLYRCLPYNFFTQKGNRLFGTIIYASVAHRALGARGGLAFCELNVLCRTVFRADSAADTRKVTFSRELWIEEENFMEVPAPKYFRLFPGNEVRLKSAYVIKCVSCDHDADGNVTAVHCTYDPDSRGGNTLDGRKIKSTIHWVDANNCVDGEIRLYDRLFTTEQPDLADSNYLDFINPNSLEIVKGAKLEAFLKDTKPADRFQFLRTGYFCADSKDSTPDHLVFNRAVSLKDSYKPE